MMIPLLGSQKRNHSSTNIWRYIFLKHPLFMYRSIYLSASGNAHLISNWSLAQLCDETSECSESLPSLPYTTLYWSNSQYCIKISLPELWLLDLKISLFEISHDIGLLLHVWHLLGFPFKRKELSNTLMCQLNHHPRHIFSESNKNLFSGACSQET